LVVVKGKRFNNIIISPFEYTMAVHTLMK
jgi:hypothetical protein